MARITGSSSKNGYGFFVDVWDTEVKDGATNTSKVGYNLYIQNNGNRFSGSNYVVDMTINGTNYGTTKSIDTTTVGFGDACLILSGTSNAITHNADGTKSVSISASVSRSSYSSYDGGYMSLRGTFTLQKIDRYFSSTPVLTYVSATETTMNFSWSTSETCSKAILYKDGTAIQTKDSLNTTSGNFDTITGLTAGTSYQWYVKCTRKDSGMDSSNTAQAKSTYPYPSISSVAVGASNMEFTLPVPGTNITQTVTLNNPLNRTNITVYAKKDNISGTQFGSVSNSSSSLSSVSLTLTTNTMYSSIPNSTSGTVAYYCVYNDGTAHTSATVTGTFKTSASNCGPTVSANPTYTNTSGTTHTNLVGTDTIIQGKSSFRVTSPTITTRGSSTVAKYYFKIGSGAYENTGTTNYKNYSSTSLSGSVIAYTYAEDSRGYTSAVKQVTMRVLPYTAPTATITAARTGYTENGSITVTATRSTLSKSNATSTDTNKWTGNTSSHKISLSISPNTGTLAALVIGTTTASSTGTVSISTLNLNTSYTITVNISDEISTVTKIVSISKANPILAIVNNNRVGINKPDPAYTLDVNGNVGIAGDVQTEGANILINPNIPGSVNIYDNVNINDNMNLTVTGNIKVGDESTTLRSITLNGGGSAQNVSGYRLIGQCTIGTWHNDRITFMVSSRHSGNGIYSIAYGCNSGTVSAETIYCQIKYHGNTDCGSVVAKNTFQAYLKNNVLSFFYYFYDGDYCSILMLDRFYGFVPENGTWMTSIDATTYGTLKASTEINCPYPVGAIYMSIDSTNPEYIFGGTWEAFAQGRTLIGMGSNGTTNYTTVGATGGSETHSHDLSNHTHTSAAHTHNLSGDGWALLNPSAQSNFLWYRVKTVTAFNENARSQITGTANTQNLGTSDRGIELGGKTNSTTPGNTGGPSANYTSTNSSMQPYITVYMWKRTA